MVEPKGGPVKPPTLDLKPSRSSQQNPKKPASGSVKKAQPAPTPSPQTPPRPEPGKPSEQKPTQTKPQTASSTRPTPKSAPNPKSASSPKSAPGPKSASGPNTTHTAVKQTGLSAMSAAIFGAIGGAILALLILVPAILTGVLQGPISGQERAQFDTQFDGINQRLTNNEEIATQSLVGFNVIDEQVVALSQSVEQQKTQNQTQFGAIAQTQQDLVEQNNALTRQTNDIASTLEAAPQIVDSPTFDPAPLEEELANLNARVSALAAGASSQDAQKLSADILQLQHDIENFNALRTADLDTAQTNQIAVEERLGTQFQSTVQASAQVAENRILLEQQDLAIGDLRSEIETLLAENEQSQQAQQSEQNPTTLPIQQIPFAIMGIQIALHNGQPFLAPLESLSVQTPGLSISEQMLLGATSGLSTPDQIAIDFSETIPLIIAARPTDPNANALTRIGDSVKSIFGLRATGLNNGDDLENLLNQTLAAIKTSHFITAKTLLADLPNPMRQPLGQLATQIDLHADVETLLNTIRTNQFEPSPIDSRSAENAQ